MNEARSSLSDVRWLLLLTDNHCEQCMEINLIKNQKFHLNQQEFNQSDTYFHRCTVSPSGAQRKNQNHCPKPIGTATGHKYNTHTQLIKEKLDNVKAEMQRISTAHLDQRPER
ncbi:hypothetical protein E1301_Tti003306 [Triplophysa tibetana]|uniref:Uncharacterized protein n=1 Tax=Triplophysa tibetana TaxID=1572043 RepID=A0A5A9PRB9_9TELE|nr:hypothetical protein E1301_Tti003306 [Triplophysa tibetana]